jgi:hypothetical protein
MNKPAPVPCPFCGKTAASTPRFTWWGGIFGTRLLGIAACQACKRSFRQSTGRPARLAILLFLLAHAALTIGLGFFLFMYISGRW